MATKPGDESTEPDAGADDEPEADPTPALPRSIWLLSENRRVLIATVAVCLLAVVLQRLVLAGYGPFLDLARADPLGLSLLLPSIIWAAYALLHVVLTWFAYRGLRGETFRAAVTADPGWLKYDARRRSRFYRWVVGVGPSSWSINFSLVALLVVVALVLRPALRELPLSFAVALVMVAASWISVAVTYAVHYARVDLTRGGLSFPGEGAQSLTDYFYLAAGVQATFGTTDVAVVRHELRVQVLTQSMLAFVFNTVIVGMVISLLLNAG